MPYIGCIIFQIRFVFHTWTSVCNSHSLLVASMPASTTPHPRLLRSRAAGVVCLLQPLSCFLGYGEQSRFAYPVRGLWIF